MSDFDTLLDTAEEDNSPEISPRNQRPDQLGALVVLTIVGIFVWGFVIWSDAKSFSHELASSRRDGLSTRNYIMGGMILLNLLGNIFCLIGASFMWRLKRTGFFFYITGQIFVIFGAILSIKFELGLINDLTGTFLLLPTAGFMLVFIVLYVQNLRHMR
ncbi:MAG: hypothetical protein ACI837_001469 [Crocinitomicaceae bacterium]|jgi:hypothetical protein